MRILQLIDSLEAGGAERMAVNYANALGESIEFSALVTTRGEGPLTSDITNKVTYLHLGKKRTLDYKALKKLREFCHDKRVDIVHAHSTSIFLAVMLKLLLGKIKVIWHDHYGNSEFLEIRSSTILKFLLRFASGAIAVNTKLKLWIKNELNFSNVIYLPNFASINLNQNQNPKTKLYGTTGKRIVCIANLRKQKNHTLLLNVAVKMKIKYPEWTFHFVGKDFNDEISRKIRNSIIEHDLTTTVFLYGSCTDTTAIVNQCEIGVLSSLSEGLPVAVLEFGMLNKAVVATAVGEIPKIIIDKKNGMLVKSGDDENFYLCLEEIILNKDLRDNLGLELQKTVSENYSEAAVFDSYLKWIKKC